MLVALKLLHTVVWAFFVACIAGIPMAALRGEHDLAAALALIVLAEVLVLAANGWQCPITAWAGRYTQDRHENFDIYLPRWLARHNQRIFGALYLAGVLWSLLLRPW